MCPRSRVCGGGAGYGRQLARVLLIRTRPARHGGLLSRFARVAPYRPLVRAVQRAAFGAVPPVAVVLKLVLMPGDTRPHDCGALVIIHVPSSPPIWYPLPPAFAHGRALARRSVTALPLHARDARHRDLGLADAPVGRPGERHRGTRGGGRT